MAQLNFTLEQEFLIGLFSENRETAYAKLMEQILNQVLLAESDEKLKASKHERCEERTDYRNGTREKPLTLRVGKVRLNVPRHRYEPFHSCIIEQYRRNEAALISTMMEMVIQGVSTRKVSKLTEQLCGQSFSKSTVSNLCKELDDQVQAFKNRPLDNNYPFVMADAMYIKIRENHRVRSKGLFVALGINEEGYKEIIGFEVYDGENESNWETFFKSLKARGLEDVDLIGSDCHIGLKNAIQTVFPNSGWQRCQVHFRKNIIDKVPKKYMKPINTALTEIFTSTTLKEARAKKEALVAEYGEKLENAMDILEEGFDDVMTVMELPEKYRKKLRTTNILERENEELRRREKVIRIFPNKASAIRLMGAVLLDHHENWMYGNKVLDMEMYEKECVEMETEKSKLETVA